MEQTVIAYYDAILRRDPTPTEINTWTGFLEGSDNPSNALSEFALALCQQADDVRSILRLYQAIFDRTSDSGGLTYWVGRFRDVQNDNPGLTYKDALIETIQQWLASDEFLDTFGNNLSDEEFLSIVYLNILGRPADQGGFDYWLGRLQDPPNPMTREQMIVEFTESVEFKDQVDDEADGLLKAAAALASNVSEDDPPYDFPEGHPYTGELANEAPQDIILGNAANVGESATEGDVAVWLRAVDPDGGEVFHWTLLDDANGAFRIVDPDAQQPEIAVADPGRLVGPEMTVRVRVTDREGNTYDKDVTIDVTAVNSAPFNLDLSNRVIDEQDGPASSPGTAGAVIGLLSADDTDPADILVFEVVNDPRFGIANGNQLIVADPSAFDAEAGVSNIDVTIRATDGAGTGLATERTFTIEVTPINDEDPTNVLPETLNVATTLPVFTTLADLVAEDPDTIPDSHTFSIAPGGDPTGGAFSVNSTGTRLLLANPSLINASNLTDGLSPAAGGIDLDGTPNGFVVFDLDVLITDSSGNSFADTIKVTVDQTGTIIPLTGAASEMLDGTSGSDVFTAYAGIGPITPFPGFNRTANSGDVVNGWDGNDRFELTKHEYSDSDGASLVTGVALNKVESVLIVNDDRSVAPRADSLGLLDDLCTPIILMPKTAHSSDDPVVFDASLSPDLDQIAVVRSFASVGLWGIQDDLWTADLSNPSDFGLIVDLVDVTGNFVWIDSDPQSKLADVAVDELRFQLNEVYVNDLRITENARGVESGGPRSEQIGTISLQASEFPSAIGGVTNGWMGGQVLPGWPESFGGSFQPTTHTLNLEVGNLTGSRPSGETGPVVADANTEAIDLFVGHVNGIGAGLVGLENVNIIGGGDVFLVFDETANDVNGDSDSFPMEIVDGEGNGFFFFEKGGFSSISIDGGDGFDTLGLFSRDLSGLGRIGNIERIEVLAAAGPSASTNLSLAAVGDSSLRELVLADGVSGDLRIGDIPDLANTGETQDLPEDFGKRGTQLVFDQCCNDYGYLPNDFDLFLDAEGSGARVDTIFKVDPNNFDGQRIDNFNTLNIQTLLVQVADCDPSTPGSFEVNHLGSQDFALRTLLLTDTGSAGTTRILNDDLTFDPRTSTIFFDEANPFGPASSASVKLDLINGAGGVRHQEFMMFDTTQLSILPFLPALESWGAAGGGNRPAGGGFYANAAGIEDELVVSDDGMTADLGEGNDMITGNRITADGDAGHLGADLIRGNGGNDLILGAAGNDQLEGGTGDDELQGESGDDSLWGDAGGDLLIGGGGDDYADGGDDDDIILGGSGKDLLRGSAGHDAICGGDGNDSLLGGDDGDLLVGGSGDDFLDAGAEGWDALVGDYNCEFRTVTLTVPTELRNWDEFNVAIDWDGDGVTDFVAMTAVEPIMGAEETAADLAGKLNANLALQSELTRRHFDISADGRQVVISKVAEDAPVVDFYGRDAAISSVHKSALGGMIGHGDKFTWDVSWNGHSNVMYTYTFDAMAPGDSLALVLSSDGLVDSTDELRALAADIAADFGRFRPIPMATASFRMEADADGNLCLSGPGLSGETPVVAVSAVDGSASDTGGVRQVSRIDFGTGGGFQDIGDLISIDVNNSVLDADIEISGFMTAAEIAARAVAIINGNGPTTLVVGAEVDPNDDASIILTSRLPGAFSTSIDIVDDTIGDELAMVGSLDLGPGGFLSIQVDTNAPVDLAPAAYGVDFNTDLETTFGDFVSTFADAILSVHDLIVEVVENFLVFTRANAPIASVGTLAGGDLDSEITVQGLGNSEVIVIVDSVNNAGTAPTVSLVTAGSDGTQDLTQSLTAVSQTAGIPPVDVDYEEEVSAVTEPDQDVFVTSARANNEAAFGPDGYDNDRLPSLDFRDLFAAAGLHTPSNGPDGGVDGVVHVMDFNQGGGGDLLNTFDSNEALSKVDNTTVDGRFWRELTDTFGADDERREGDKLAFRKLDGALDECGTADNYTEVEDTSSTRDDADAGALGAFSGDPELRYYANARTFDDALLDNHGLRWGIDITQAIVDDAIADLADDGFANNSAGGIAAGSWGNASDLLGGADSVNADNISAGILERAKGESWLRVYYNEAGTDAAPEAVMELVGLDSTSQISFADIVGGDCITDPDEFRDPIDIWLAA